MGIVDLRPGAAAVGCKYWSTGVYCEIIPLEKIVAIDSFADEKGNIVPASHYGMAGDCPLELLVTLTFQEQGNMTKFTPPTRRATTVGTNLSTNLLNRYANHFDLFAISLDSAKKVSSLCI